MGFFFSLGSRVLQHSVHVDLHCPARVPWNSAEWKVPGLPVYPLHKSIVGQHGFPSSGSMGVT